jgi:hypothetical protein
MSINTSKLYSFYLAIVSFVALVAIAINLWIVLTSIGQYFLITDDEYLQNREYYKIEQCETGSNIVERWVVAKEEFVKRTAEEIEACKETVKESVSASRSYSMKEMFISSWAWMIVFIIIFAFHYPKFMREKNSK